MIRGIRLRECGELVVLFPVELTTIYNHTTEAGAVAAQELGCRMYNDVCTMLQRTDEIRRTKGIIDNKWNAVLVGYCCHTFQVEHVAVGVAEGLGIYYFCVGFDSCFQGVEVVHINNRVGDALSSQRMRNQVVGTAIEVISSNDMITGLHNVLQGVGDGSSTRGHSQTSHTALEGSHTVFEHTLGRVGQAAIDITCIAQTKTVGSVL